MMEKSPIEQRLEMKAELDRAMEAGELTIDQLRAIPPTATSSEHHISLMKRLRAQEGLDARTVSVEAMAFLATKDALEELLYEESPTVIA